MNDIIGTIISIYEVQYLCDCKTSDGHKKYHVKCTQCGYETDMKKSGIFRTLKCNHKNTAGIYKKYGPTQFTNKRIKHIYNDMKNRCYNSNNRDYRWYGEKGITICDEWLISPKSFEKWAIINGYNDNLTIDRIDSNKNYCPENCRWITLEDNAKYKISTSLIDVDGEIHTGRDWAKILNFGCNLINSYVRKYGLDNTVEFIRRCKKNPLQDYNVNQSYYKIYMDNNNTK